MRFPSLTECLTTDKNITFTSEVNCNFSKIAFQSQRRNCHGRAEEPRDEKEDKIEPSGTAVDSTNIVVNGLGNCLLGYPNKSTCNAETVDLRELNKDKCQTVAVHSAKSGRTKMELHNSTSTQSLGLNSVAGESIVFSKKSRRVVIFFSIVCFLLLSACVILSVLYARQVKQANQVNGNGESAIPTTMPSTDVCNTAECLKVAGEFMRNINSSVDPCDDFYHYACDGWIRDNPIAPSENEQATYIKTTKLTLAKLRGLIEDATNLKPGSALRKVHDHYTACMDEREVERTSAKELMELLREFGSWALDNSTWNETAWEWKDALLKIHKVYSDDETPLFWLDVAEDPTNSSRYLLTVIRCYFF